MSNIYKSKACVPLLFLLLVMKLWRSRRIFWTPFQGSKLENDNQDSVLDLVLSMNKTLNNQCIVVGSIYNDSFWLLTFMKSIIGLFYYSHSLWHLSYNCKLFLVTDSSVWWTRAASLNVCSWKLFDYSKYYTKKIRMMFYFCFVSTLREWSGTLLFQYDKELEDSPDVESSRMFCIREHDPENCSMRVQQVK